MAGNFFISLAYAGVGLKLTGMFQTRGYAIPAGICATFVVALTPLAIYGLQQGMVVVKPVPGISQVGQVALAVAERGHGGWRSDGRRYRCPL